MCWEVVGLEWGPLSLVSTTTTWKKKSDLESREYCHKDPSRWSRGTPYPPNLALTSLTSGGLSTGIVRSRTQATKFSFSLYWQWEYLALIIILAFTTHSSSLAAPPWRNQLQLTVILQYLCGQHRMRQPSERNKFEMAKIKRKPFRVAGKWMKLQKRSSRNRLGEYSSGAADRRQRALELDRAQDGTPTFERLPEWYALRTLCHRLEYSACSHNPRNGSNIFTLEEDPSIFITFLFLVQLYNS
jgi:hypothetical protein